MKFKVILMGKSKNLTAQAEQVYGFINSNLQDEDATGSTVLLVTKEADPSFALNQAPTDNVERVRVGDYHPETILKGLQKLEAAGDTDLYLFPFGVLADEVAVRWACRINGSSLVQVKSIHRSRTEFQAKKAVYANHVMATFRMTRRPYCISLSKDGIAAASIPIREKASIEEHDLSELHADRPSNSEWMPEEPASDLESARFLVVGGRGMGSAGACRELEKKANSIGADFGASRPVVMSAWAHMHRLVGASGSIAKPDVCIAAAVSGAAAFYVGIANSKKIIAINSDDRAPILKAADVVIVEDYKVIMDALAKVILEAKADEKA